MARISLGNARKISERRIKISSIALPKYPASTPITNPSGVLIAATRTSDAQGDTGAEYHPRVDVPPETVGTEIVLPRRRLQPVR